MGHGLSATILGVLAFGLKNQVQKAPRLKGILAGASHVTEIAVGLSLIVIGAMGIKEARAWQQEEENATPAQSLSSAATPIISSADSVQKRAVIFNGLLHGFSWDGAPSLAPAIAVATWAGNLAFLSAYAAGTMAAMAITTTLIGEGTRRAGEVFNRPDIPQKLSLYSSGLAIAIGLIWCGLALKP
jgi:sulfite exporter TauE/SafE